MSFTEEFFFTGKTRGELSPLLRNVIEIANHERAQAGEMQAIRKAHEKSSRLQQEMVLRDRADRGIDRDIIVRELAYSHERIADRIVRAVQEQGEATCEGLQSICDILGWGFAEIKWTLDQQTRLGQQVLDTLLSSLDVASKQRMQQGIKCFDVAEYDRSKKCFKEALDANPTASYAYQYLGRIAVLQDSPSEAISNFELAIKFTDNPQSKALALSQAARCHWLIGDLEKAIQKSILAVKLQPESANLHFDLGGQLAAARQVEDAIGALRNAIEIDQHYWARAAVDEGLSPIRSHVDALLFELNNKARRAAEIALQKQFKLIDGAMRLGCGDVMKEHASRFLAQLLQFATGSYSQFLEVTSAIDLAAGDIKTTVGKALELKIDETKRQMLSKEKEKFAAISTSEFHNRAEARGIESEIHDCERRIRQLSETWKKREPWRWGGKVTGSSAMGCGTVAFASLIVAVLIQQTKQPLPNILASLMCLVVWVKAPSIAEYFRYLISVKLPENQLLRSLTELRLKLERAVKAARDRVVAETVRIEAAYRSDNESLQNKKDALEAKLKAWCE